MHRALSIIIPVLNEADGLPAALGKLAAAREAGAEILVVDGGSTDATISAALPHCTRVLNAPRGRASQMNAGAAAANGNIFVFLHADTILPAGGLASIIHSLADRRRHWGRFDVAIDGSSPMLRLIALMMNIRSRLTGIATGDQAIFVRRGAFERAGPFPDIPLMEDIALSKKLKRIGRPACLRKKVTTSGRRWEKHGVLRTVAAMWRLRLAYYFGADPKKLARAYGYIPRTDK